MKDRSVLAALVLTFFFGPFGVLYVSIPWGLIWIVVSAVVVIATVGLGAFLVWPVSMVWAAIAASNQHGRYQAWLAGR
jgi:hypothetical protein